MTRLIGVHFWLPQVITLPHKPSRPPYTRPGQFAGRLGMEHDPFYLRGDEAEPLDFKVPFITVFLKENVKIQEKCKNAEGWDTHGDNFDCLQNYLLPEFDRTYSALIEDLAERGLLEETLVLVSSEMGRKPRIGDPRSGGKLGAGRDHWTSCMSVLLAGGGIQGCQVLGSSDRLGEYPYDNPLGPEDITKTVYHAMGIDDLTAETPDGRPFNLLEDGRALTELF